MNSDGEKRVALVTGASRGIGRAIALGLADIGFDVAIAARTLDPAAGPARRRDGSPFAGSLRETAAAITERGARALPLPFDLRDPTTAPGVVQATIDAWGRIDVLVNNAVYVSDTAQARIVDIDIAALTPVFEANITTQVELARCAVRDMRRRNAPGCVINMGSAASHVDPIAPSGDRSFGFGYAALKAALARMAPMLHAEHQSEGIHAWTLEPGTIPTESFRSAFSAEVLDALLSSPDIGFVTEDVPAAVVQWLAGAPPAAQSLSGQTLDCEAMCREHALLPEDRILLTPDLLGRAT